MKNYSAAAREYEDYVDREMDKYLDSDECQEDDGYEDYVDMVESDRRLER